VLSIFAGKKGSEGRNVTNIKEEQKVPTKSLKKRRKDSGSDSAEEDVPKKSKAKKSSR